jgi:hypothetical protein
MLGGHETEAEYQPSLVQGKARQFVVRSGCSGAGISSLLAELGRRGFRFTRNRAAKSSRNSFTSAVTRCRGETRPNSSS